MWESGTVSVLRRLRELQQVLFLILNPYPEIQLDDTLTEQRGLWYLSFLKRRRGPVTPYMFLNIFGRDYSGR